MDSATDAVDLIGIVEKNRSEDVRVALSEFNGYPLIDVRTYAAFGHDGERKATKKGVSLRVERLPTLIAVLTRAAIEAERRGLIDAKPPIPA